MTIQEMINLLVKKHKAIMIECDNTGIAIYKSYEHNPYIYSDSGLEEGLKEAVDKIKE